MTDCKPRIDTAAVLRFRVRARSGPSSASVLSSPRSASTTKAMWIPARTSLKQTAARRRRCDEITDSRSPTRATRRAPKAMPYSRVPLLSREATADMFALARQLGAWKPSPTAGDRPERSIGCASLILPGYKISSGMLTATPLVEHAARQGLPLLMSTGMGGHGGSSAPDRGRPHAPAATTSD